MSLTQEQRIARHKSFLKANWEPMAAFSWSHYLAKGRGAVLVPEQDFVHAATPQLKGLRFRYLPLIDRTRPPFKGVLAGKELDWLESYDPDQRVVVCILRQEGGISSYLIGGRPRPSESFVRQRAKGD